MKRIEKEIENKIKETLSRLASCGQSIFYGTSAIYY